VIDRAFFGHDAVLRVVATGLADREPLLVRVTGPGAPAPGTDVLLTVRAPVMAWPAPDPAGAVVIDIDGDAADAEGTHLTRQARRPADQEISS
jgi:hypothetical protein